MNDNFHTTGNGTTIQYGPRRDEGNGSMVPCSREEAQVWGMYVCKPGEVGFDWFADCVSEAAAVAIAFGLLCAFGEQK